MVAADQVGRAMDLAVPEMELFPACQTANVTTGGKATALGVVVAKIAAGDYALITLYSYPTGCRPIDFVNEEDGFVIDHMDYDIVTDYMETWMGEGTPSMDAALYMDFTGSISNTTGAGKALNDDGYGWDAIHDDAIVNLASYDADAKLIRIDGSDVTYKAIVVQSTSVPVNTMKALQRLAAQGAKVVFFGVTPSRHPGYAGGQYAAADAQVAEIAAAMLAQNAVTITVPDRFVSCYWLNQTTGQIHMADVADGKVMITLDDTAAAAAGDEAGQKLYQYYKDIEESSYSWPAGFQSNYVAAGMTGPVSIDLYAENAAVVELTGDTDVTLEQDALTYTVTAANTDRLATADLTLALSGNVDTVDVTADEGWYVLSSRYADGILHVMVCNNQGLSAEEAAEFFGSMDNFIDFVDQCRLLLYLNHAILQQENKKDKGDTQHETTNSCIGIGHADAAFGPAHGHGGGGGSGNG